MGQDTSSSRADIVPGVADSIVAVVRRIRVLLVTSVVAALANSILITASRGRCYSETGECVVLQMSASPVLFLGFAIVVFFALDRIIRRNLDPFEASLTLDRARRAIMIFAGVAVVVAHVWFWSIPMEGFGSGGVNFISPFLFGVIDLTTSRGG